MMQEGREVRSIKGEMEPKMEKDKEQKRKTGKKNKKRKNSTCIIGFKESNDNVAIIKFTLDTNMIVKIVQVIN